LREENETFDQIEKYLQGTLSKEEHAMVEDRINMDSSFAEEVKLSSQVNNVVMGAAMDKLRERMTKDIADFDLHKNNKYKWWTGSSIVLLALISSLYVYVKKEDASAIIPGKDPKQGSIVSSNTANELKKNETIVSSKLKTENNLPVEKNQQEEKQESTVSPIENPPLQTDKDTEEHTIQEDKQVNNLKNEPPQKADPTVKTNTEKCHLSFKPVVHPTCRGEATGSIEIDPESIEGGKAPYIFVMDHTGIESGSGYFRALAEGIHLITVKDKSGCTASQEVNLPERNCQTKKSFAINPDLGETFKVPYHEGESGKFTILNKGGIVIFRGNFGSSELNEWNGTDSNGATAAIGIYVCLIEYTNGKSENIQITVIR
jgi:hypothetical protein